MILKKKQSTTLRWSVMLVAFLMVCLNVCFGAQSPGQSAVPVQEPGFVFALLSQPLIAVFLVIAVGMLLGQINIKGISLGSSGVLFSALAYGAFINKYTDSMSDIGAVKSSFGVLGKMGLVLFVYCIGLAAGPTFFRSFASGAKNLVKLGVLIVVLGSLTTVLCAIFFDVPVDLAVGIFAGALTSTPGLAAATEAVGHVGGEVYNVPNVVVGYGIAYAFGVVGVVLFVQLLPRLLGHDLQKIGDETKGGDPERAIVRTLVHVTNDAVVGRNVDQVQLIGEMMCVISRVVKDGKLIPLTEDFTFEKDQHVMVVGRKFRVQSVIEYLGSKSNEQPHIDLERERRRVVATDKQIVGKTFDDLRPVRTWGVTVTRVLRMDVQFVPRSDEVIQNGDVLTVVGEPEDINKFAAAAGHREAAVHETDIISLAIGIVAGVVLGMTPLSLPGSESISFKLGLAGGPLIMALLLGHFGRIGRVVGRMPRASRIVLLDLGLVFFLANAGVKAGGQMLITLEQQGPLLLLMGAIVTSVPMLIAYMAARLWLKMPVLEVLGAVCGGMTSTPGLGAITAKTDSDTPVISYAAAYPIALILMTFFAKFMVSLLA